MNKNEAIGRKVVELNSARQKDAILLKDGISCASIFLDFWSFNLIGEEQNYLFITRS